MAIGWPEKKALYERLKKENKEGIVFKKFHSFYTPGKAHEDMWKFKFYAEASVRVCSGREGKHSVGMEVRDGDKWVGIGNVTIGTTLKLPSVGSVISVKYLYAHLGGSLVQPCYQGIQDDRGDDECLISQLKYKAEEE